MSDRKKKHGVYLSTRSGWTYRPVPDAQIDHVPDGEIALCARGCGREVRHYRNQPERHRDPRKGNKAFCV